MATVNITTRVQAGGTEVISRTNTYSASGLIKVNEAIANGQTDKVVTFTADQSAMSAFWLMSDQIVTVETNNGTTPTDTFVLTANEPLVWVSTGEYTNPITADITAIYITNASGSTANVEIGVLQDATP